MLPCPLGAVRGHEEVEGLLAVEVGCVLPVYWS